MTFSLEDAWDRMESFAVAHGGDPWITRTGRSFSYTFDMNGHDVSVWVIGEAPRFCCQVDGVLSLRISNLRVLDILLGHLCEQPDPWTGEEVFDPE